MSIPFHSLVPLVHVRSVPKSIAFYERLGFDVPYSYKGNDEPELSWAFLKSGGASLMLALATEPVVAAQQRVQIALYVNDIEGKHREILDAGVKAGPIEHPFFRPRGQFTLQDPDGYAISVQTPERS